MKSINRRDFIKLGSGSLVAGSAGLAIPQLAIGATKKVVVIGGGAGGTIAAKYIRQSDSSIDVTLIETNKEHYTCFMSNEVIGGDRKITTIKHPYDGLKKYGINIVHSMATAIDADKNKKIRE